MVTAATDAFSLFRFELLLCDADEPLSIGADFESGEIVVVIVAAAAAEFLVAVDFNFVTVLRFPVFDIEYVLLFKLSLLLLLLFLLLLLLLVFLFTTPLLLPLPPPIVDTDSNSLNDIRAVVGFRIVDVPQTLGCDVISHGGLGRVVVDVVCDSKTIIVIIIA